MKNQNMLLIVAAIVIIAGIVYYQQHTHTASINLPGGQGVSITTHD